jgi:ParB family transcriptional regulator, chromosome partitioning protein
MRERDGFAEIRILPTTHVTYNDTWDLRPLKGETPPLTTEQESRLAEIKSELEAANEAFEEVGDEASVALANRIELLEAEYRSIEKPAPILSDEQKTGAMAYLVIGHDGQPRLHEQLYVAPVDELPAARLSFEGLAEEVIEPDESLRGKPVYSQRMAQDLAEMKSELLRIHIASDPRFALDLGTFWMVDKAFRIDDAADLATDLSAKQPGSAPAGFHSGTLAAEEWARIDQALDRSWTGAGNAIQRYDAFCALGDEDRAAWLAWAIARTLHAVAAGGSGEAFINHLGASFDIDEAAWWRPTANNYFDRLNGKAAILAHIEEVGGKELAARYGASKKHDLSTSAEKIFAGDVPLETEVRETAMRWVPDAMRFRRPMPEADSGAAHDRDAPDDEGPLSQAA